ncbi:MAG: hypothetical protein ALAOOOJD_02809 [bacterium]|nr:hypothetical protein [bacterium]
MVRLPVKNRPGVECAKLIRHNRRHQEPPRKTLADVARAHKLRFCVSNSIALTFYLIASNSISKMSVAFGPIVPPAPRGP